MKKVIRLNDEDYGGRLDYVLAMHVPHLSRSHLAKIIRTDKVMVNSNPSKASYKLKTGDKVVIWLKQAQPSPVDIPIIYEDKSVVVVDKPVGVLVHSKGSQHDEYTINDFMKDKYDGSSAKRGAIVHRLDRTTSGVMICAKSDEVATFLQLQFSDRKVTKTYTALVEGAPEEDEATLDLPIERNPKRPNTFRVGPNGKPSQTLFTVIERRADTTLMSLRPRTGRTHQLRVHMTFLGLPIVGDELYGGRKAPRVMLHASKLVIILPDRQQHAFEAKLPKEFGDE